jgi:hypothetical protein
MFSFYHAFHLWSKDTSALKFFKARPRIRDRGDEPDSLSAITVESRLESAKAVTPSPSSEQT